MSSEVSGIQGSGDPSWQTQYSEMKAHLAELMGEGEHPHKAHVFEAIEYIATSFFNLMGNFTEGFRMGSQAKIENLLTKMQNDRNTIEQSFDDQKVAADPDAAKAAMVAYQDITKILNDNKQIIDPNTGKVTGGIFSADFIKSVETQFVNPSATDGTIFQGDTINPNDPEATAALASTWSKLWATPNPGSGIAPAIQSVTNGLTAVSTDFSSQSSVAQSKLKYYETWDEQYKSITHSVMSDYINQEKSPNSKSTPS